MGNIFQQAADRPRFDLEPSSLERVLGIAAWLGVGVNVLVIFYYWPQLPERVPQHFDFTGQADTWGPSVWLLGLPAISLAVVGGLSWLTRFPHLYNFAWEITEDNARRQYELANQLLAAIGMFTAWLFALISWEVCRLSIGEPPLLGLFFLPFGLSGIFGSLIWYFVVAYRER